jgi:hypothetical protein
LVLVGFLEFYLSINETFAFPCTDGVVSWLYHQVVRWIDLINADTLCVLGLIPGRGKIFFFFSEMSRSALGPSQPPILWVSRALSLGFKLTEA